jgi:hypothetical protein
MRGRMLVEAAAICWWVAACSNAMPPTAEATLTNSSPSTLLGPTEAPVSTAPVEGGCGATQVFAGPGPDAALGLANNSWASATPPEAGIVAYFWYMPPGVSFASRSMNDAPKVLWISHDERGHLLIAAHPLGATEPLVRFEVPPAAAPAGNYPSSIALPTAGCWHFELTLGSARAAMDLSVAPGPTPTP